ncbi:MAG: DNA recombination protein RmuC [Bacilli bacterium]|nr:DNA recombination protein RmuC [Bacilli bacterium]
MIDILILVVAVLALVSSIVAIVLLLKKKTVVEGNVVVDTTKTELEIDKVKNSIAELKGALPETVKNSVSEKMVDIQKTLREGTKKTSDDWLKFQESIGKQLGENIEKDNRRMADFQDKMSKNLSESIEAINKKVDDNMKSINDKVTDSLKTGFKDTSESMEKLQKALGEIDAAQRNIESLSGEVVSLKGILTNNQQRGRYGEMQLEMIIESMFGEAYKGSLYDFQFQLKGSTLRPDAVVFLDGEEKEKIMCIDSKFAITGYEGLFGDSKVSDEEKTSLKKDFKVGITNQVKEVFKYVESGLVLKPAIMFIPNDGVFAYIQNEFPEIVEEARKKSVILASPTILQPIIASFRVVQIDAKRTKNLETITKALESLADEFRRFDARWKKIQSSISTLGKATNEFDTTVDKMSKKFMAISKSEVTQIEAPDEEADESIDSEQ